MTSQHLRGNKEDNDKDSNIKFVVTGFGPFRGVPTNPTSQLVDLLLRQHNNKGPLSSTIQLVDALVLETSTQDVKRRLQECKEKYLNKHHDDDSVWMFLHLGVNYKGTCMHLEEYAYNDASFRIPDELGYQPQKECIVETEEWNHRLVTAVPLATLITDRKRKKAQQEQEKVVVQEKVSHDPGRFVCNYTYYTSLHDLAEQSDEGGPKIFSLFLHVPPVSVLPIDVQLDYVLDLMKRLQETIIQESLKAA